MDVIDPADEPSLEPGPELTPCDPGDFGHALFVEPPPGPIEIGPEDIGPPGGLGSSPEDSTASSDE